MGWRSVRVSLDNRDIFRTQIEAILMAGQHGQVKLLFPMISSMDETNACLEVIEEARANLTRRRYQVCRKRPGRRHDRGPRSSQDRPTAR